MKLAADASAIVAEVLRSRGRRLIASAHLDLHIARPMLSEVFHEVGRRLDEMVRHGRLHQSRRELVYRQAVSLVTRKLTVIDAGFFEHLEPEARDRIPQDPNDWPTVALAMALGSGIWTIDKDFLGCGVPVWTTETLLRHVETGRARVTP